VKIVAAQCDPRYCHMQYPRRVGREILCDTPPAATLSQAKGLTQFNALAQRTHTPSPKGRAWRRNGGIWTHPLPVSEMHCRATDLSSPAD